MIKSQSTTRYLSLAVFAATIPLASVLVFSIWNSGQVIIPGRSGLPAEKVIRLLERYYPAADLHGPSESQLQRIAPRSDGTFSVTENPVELNFPDALNALKPEEQAALKSRALRESIKQADYALKTVFPKSIAGPMSVRSGSSEVIARPLNAKNSQGVPACDGSLVYSDVFDGCDVVYRSTVHKTEEFLCINGNGPAKRSWSWDLELGSGDAAMYPRLTPAGSIELIDCKGSAGLRINAPEGRDASGKLLRAGERLHFTLAQPRAGSVRVTLVADLGDLKFPVVIDPSFSATVSLSGGRGEHTATLLSNGKVLVAGGSNGTVLATCELFDPAGNGGVGSWTATGSMPTARTQHLTIRLQNGKLLAIGGKDNSATALANCEIFDPAGNGGVGSWTATGSLATARVDNTATLLQNGKVLVTGGNGPIPSAELFDPSANSGVGSWTATGSMITARQFHTETLFPDGKVLISGGAAGNLSEISTAELFDPAGNAGIGSFTATGPMTSGRFFHKNVLLQTGKVLAIGGQTTPFVPSSELYDPSSGFWSATGSMSKGRTQHRVAILANGKVLVAGCHDGSFAVVELYDPAGNGGLGTWSLVAPLSTARENHSMTLLADGRVLVVGGHIGTYLSSVETYDPRPEPVAQSVSANGGSPLAITLSANSIDYGSPSFTVQLTPFNGTLSGIPPNLVYTANPGYFGNDGFTFVATDSFGTSAAVAVSITVNSIIPTITSTRPEAAIAGSTGFTLTVNGSNFVTGTTVQWNGSNRTTTYVSPSQLTAVITTADISSAAPINVTAINPAPGGGASSAKVFSVVGGALATWIVNNTNDSGPNSLRYAMNNVRAGDSIFFDPVVFDLFNASAATVINVLSALPTLDKGNVTIDAQNRRVTINGTGAGTSCGLMITTNGNRIIGLNIIGFTKSGICISGGLNNIIGGNRALPTTGAGPNGQGLRISNCGAFGIEITDAACTNIVKGCWIGTDASGTKEEPNLAGIVIQGAACGNQIGSILPDEANVISGNRFEGVTVSGTGTDNNVVMGNIIGASAVTSAIRGADSRDDSTSFTGRSGVGNGNAGIFLSKGTNGTKVGGTASEEGNAIGFNGGNGIEIRAPTSKNNSARRNGISKNRSGGITLFDGSNNDIKPPDIDDVALMMAPSPTASVRVRVKGRSPVVGGSVEIFTDTGSQGGSFVGRSGISGGIFVVDVDVTQSENITATVTDANGSTSSFAVFGKAPGLTAPTITSALSAAAVVGTAFTYTFTATGVQPITFSAATLPAGLTLSGDTISGIPTTAGTYTISITATNAADSSSKALLLVVSAATTVNSDGSFSTSDTDGDGVLDVLENLAGTDSNNADDEPTDGGTLTVANLQIGLNFVKTSRDSILAALNLTLPDGFVTEGSLVSVQFGATTASNLELNSSGVSPKGSMMVMLKPAGTGSTSAALKFMVRNADLLADFTECGLTDKTTEVGGEKIVVPVAVAIQTGATKYFYNSNVTVLYQARQSKSGKARKAK